MRARWHAHQDQSAKDACKAFRSSLQLVVGNSISYGALCMLSDSKLKELAVTFATFLLARQRVDDADKKCTYSAESAFQWPDKLEPDAVSAEMLTESAGMAPFFASDGTFRFHDLTFYASVLGPGTPTPLPFQVPCRRMVRE